MLGDPKTFLGTPDGKGRHADRKDDGEGEKKNELSNTTKRGQKIEHTTWCCKVKSKPPKCGGRLLSLDWKHIKKKKMTPGVIIKNGKKEHKCEWWRGIVRSCAWAKATNRGMCPVNKSGRKF